MKKFKKQLSLILSKSENGSIPVHQRSLNLPEAELRYLSARGLIELSSAGDNLFYFVPTPNGIAYFDLKKESKIDFIKDLLSRFSVGVATGVTTTLLVEHIILPLLSKV